MSSPLSPSNRAAVAAEEKPAPAGPARILLVDDDPVNQMVALGLLRRHGWQAVPANNGKEALQILAQQRFDLVLMDLQMPEMDGYQTAAAIRQNEAYSAQAAPDSRRQRPEGKAARIPIIALTTASQPGVREKCLAAGMDDYLTKPINARQLYITVEKYLGGRP